MRFRILGPLALFNGTEWLGINAARSRSLLAALLIRAGDVVSIDQLIFELWGDQPAKTAATQIHGSVMRIRRALGDDGGRLLVTSGRGYRLAAGADEVDAAVFAATADRGRAALRAGRTDQAADLLTAALDLWRGPALCDVAPTELITAEASRLAEQHLAAWAARVDADLARGRDATVIDELRCYVEQHPLRQQQWRQLMVALYRSGRTAEALAAFRRLREILIEQVGAEPSGELHRLYRRMVAGEPVEPVPGATNGVAAGAGPVPRLLPAVTPFVGRTTELARLDALLDTGDDRAATVVVITGAAGAGKTALAAHWGNRVADRFPDGQLYADLRGYGPGRPVPPTVVLAQFLRALGVEAEGVPGDEDSRAALYRTLLANRHMLVVLDNASGSDQVRALLPGPSACLTVVTSRADLRGLVATHGPHCLRLLELDPDAAVALLAGVLGAHRAAAEPDRVAELATLCGRLPLALRIAAADAAGRPERTIGEQVAELRGGDRLERLVVAGEEHIAVRAAFDTSYRALPDPARWLFCLLGLVPGPDFTVRTAAALAGTTPRAAAALLDQLCAAHMIEPRSAARFGCHDLLALYAREQARTQLEPCTRDRALRGLFTHYLSTARRATELITPNMVRMPISPEPEADRADLARPGDAIAWLDAERANLVAAIGSAAGHGFPAFAWQLADALRGYFSTRLLGDEWLACAHTGLAAATEESSPMGQATMQHSLGLAHETLGDYRAAIDRYRQAETWCERAGWPAGRASTLSGLGRCALQLGEPRRALALLHRALAIDRVVGYRGGEARELYNIGLAHQVAGRLDRAIEYQRRSLRRYEELDDERGQCIVADNLALVRRMTGDLDAALAGHTRALRIARRLGWQHAQATVLCHLAAVHRDAGRFELARTNADQAVSIARAGGEYQIQVHALNVLGGALAGLGRSAEAEDCYADVLGSTGSSGLAAGRVDALLGLADLSGRRGRPDSAVRYAEEAVTLARQHRLRLLESQARTVLAALTR